MAKITKAYIEDYGGKKEFDMFGGINIPLLGGHFYPTQFDKDEWAFHIVDIDVSDGSRKNYKVIDNTEEFEKEML